MSTCNQRCFLSTLFAVISYNDDDDVCWTSSASSPSVDTEYIPEWIVTAMKCAQRPVPHTVFSERDVDEADKPNTWSRRTGMAFRCEFVDSWIPSQPACDALLSVRNDNVYVSSPPIMIISEISDIVLDRILYLRCSIAVHACFFLPRLDWNISVVCWICVTNNNTNKKRRRIVIIADCNLVVIFNLQQLTLMSHFRRQLSLLHIQTTVIFRTCPRGGARRTTD